MIKSNIKSLLSTILLIAITTFAIACAGQPDPVVETDGEPFLTIVDEGTPYAFTVEGLNADGNITGKVSVNDSAYVVIAPNMSKGSFHVMVVAFGHQYQEWDIYGTTPRQVRMSPGDYEVIVTAQYGATGTLSILSGASAETEGSAEAETSSETQMFEEMPETETEQVAENK